MFTGFQTLQDLQGLNYIEAFAIQGSEWVLVTNDKYYSVGFYDIARVQKPPPSP